MPIRRRFSDAFRDTSQQIATSSSHCEEEGRVSRKNSSDSKNDSEDEEETIKPLSPADSPVPQEEASDEGGKADSESEQSPVEGKSEKEKPPTRKKRNRKKRKKKGEMLTDEFTTLSNSGNQKRRTKSQPNKRKKIRKLLKEDELQQETIQALKEEEERQKRLELQAQLAKESIRNEAPNGSNAGMVEMPLIADNTCFPDLDYGLEFADNIEALNYQDMPDDDFNMLAATPASEFEALLSPGTSKADTALNSDVITTSSAPADTTTIHPSESTNSLSSEVARFEQILRATPPMSRASSSGSLQAATQVAKATAPPGGLIFKTDQPVRPSSTGATDSIMAPPSGAVLKAPEGKVNVDAQPVTSLTGPATTQLSQSPYLQRFLQTPDILASAKALLARGSEASAGNFKGYQPAQEFKSPTPHQEQKPAQQSSEVICISSESSDDELVKKAAQKTVINSEPINISSGTDSSDDVIFAGTDDHEIAEDDPDVNNSGMHVNDDMNQPDSDGRVLVNKNRPPDEPEIFLLPHLAAAVKPHQIGGIRFMFDNIVESLDRYEKSSGFGCILAHSMGLGKTLQVITFIDLFLRHTGAKTALCVVPVNTLLNWVAEFELWLPTKGHLIKSSDASSRTFRVRLLSDAHKTTEARAQVISSWKEEGGVLLMGYEMFRLLTNQKLRKRRKKKQKKQTTPGEIIDTIDLDEEDRFTELTSEIYEHLVRPGPDLIVCDEGHRIKNSHASISQALKQIATRRRIVLTGYPLQNNLMEYWCMVDFVRPNFLGTKQEFSNMFERPILNGQCADSNEADIRLMRFRSHVLHSLLKGFVQRRSHVVLRNSLPPKEEYVLLIRLSQWQRKLYNHFIKHQMRAGGGWNSSLNPIKAFSICCKIWNHPDVLYRTVIRKTLEEQQNSSNLIDMDLDLPDVVLDGVVTKQRRKKREVSNMVLSDICSRVDSPTETTTADGKIIQTPAIGPLAQDDRERGLNYEWAKLLMQDYTPNLAEVSGKILILMEIIHHSVANGDKILVFSQSLTTLTLIEEFLFNMNVPNPPGTPHRNRKWRKNESYFRLDGNTSTTDRERMVQMFNSKTNDSIQLFLLSTRAGCLGINLVGANRVVVFDISWNPCHDAQAVCRVYRYGQTKKCVIYRLICDQSMEKKIYDRQISKQGMSDRVVDELNPIQSLERQDITKLLVYEDDEKPEVDLSNLENECTDNTLIHACKVYGNWLTRHPFHHESLLMDCKSQRLTKAEKRAAQQGYEQEKRASSSCNYSRPSYASFYAAAGYPAKKKPGSTSILPTSTATTARPVANVKPVQSSPYPLRIGAGMAPGQMGTFDPQTIAYLQRSGINVRKMIANSDIPMPTASVTVCGAPPRPLIAKGEPFYMINGRKGTYIGTTNGRIFALRSNKQEERETKSPLVKSATGQMVTTREHESQVIKSAFSYACHPLAAARAQNPQGYLPGARPMGAQGLQAPMGYPRYPGPAMGNMMHMMTGQSDQSAGTSSVTQHNNMQTQQNNMMTQPGNMMTQQNGMMTQQNNMLTQQTQPVGGMTQQNLTTTQNQSANTMQQQPGTLTPQNGVVTQHSNMMTLQNNLMTQQSAHQSNTPSQHAMPPMAGHGYQQGTFMGNLGLSNPLPWTVQGQDMNSSGPTVLPPLPPAYVGQQNSLSSVGMWQSGARAEGMESAPDSTAGHVTNASQGSSKQDFLPTQNGMVTQHNDVAMTQQSNNSMDVTPAASASAQVTENSFPELASLIAGQPPQFPPAQSWQTTSVPAPLPDYTRANEPITAQTSSGETTQPVATINMDTSNAGGQAANFTNQFFTASTDNQSSNSSLLGQLAPATMNMSNEKSPPSTLPSSDMQYNTDFSQLDLDSSLGMKFSL